MVKLFAHRGYAIDGDTENSVASLKNAIRYGFRAIEFDVWFADNELLINHDKPATDKFNNLPRFKDYLIYGNDIEYWVDFKNLNQENIDIVLNLLKNDIASNNISFDKIFFAPFETNYRKAEIIIDRFYSFFGSQLNSVNRVKFVSVCDDPSQISDFIKLINKYSANYASLNFQLINEDLVQKIDPAKILAWTVNDIKVLNNLAKIGINKFATDKIVPQIFPIKI